MNSKIKPGDIVHHRAKRYGIVIELAPKVPRNKYWDTQVFWTVEWLDLGVIDSLKQEGIRAKYKEVMPERDLMACDIDQERRVLVGALHALSRKSWQSRGNDDTPEHDSAWSGEGRR